MEKGRENTNRVMGYNKSRVQSLVAKTIRPAQDPHECNKSSQPRGVLFYFQPWTLFSCGNQRRNHKESAK